MFKLTYRSFPAICIAIAVTLAAPTSILARTVRQNSAPPKDESKDKKKKDEKESSKEAQPKISKQERKYQEIKKFSQDRYDKNVEFHDEVDEAYRQKQRDHSEYAYNINTRDLTDERVTRTGDKLKVEDTLYDNPLAQDYVNRVGQSLVPASSPRLYAFKITLNPIPEARSLSTGTVYISSGLLSQVDNEAQLAYVLGHEIAHVERDHWREDVLVQHGLDDYNEKQQQKRKIFSGITSIGIGVMTGGLGGSISNAANAAFFAEAFVMPNILKIAVPHAVVSWDKMQEDEADQLGLQYMLHRNYDPREVQRFYENLAGTTRRDKRAGLGFIGSAARITERVQQVSNIMGGFGGSMQEKVLIGSVNLRAQHQVNQMTEAMSAAQAGAQPTTPDTGKTLDPTRNAAERAAAAQKALSLGPMSAEMQAKLDAGELIGSTAEFEAVMAELKRDNGVRAYYYDMFHMARTNLEESLKIRSNDPYSHFYYGKVLKLTARTAGEKSRALSEFVTAIQLDKRKVLPEARLHRALALIEKKDATQMHEIVANLKEYVSLYQREHGGSLPPNMDVIYDYMQEANELTWSATPAMNVSTKNIEPIYTAPGQTGAPRPVAASDAPTAAPASVQPAADKKAAPRAGKRQ
jgi:predicted Zn-dependent protease